MEELHDPFNIRNNTLRRVSPNFHIKISLTMIKWFGTWPPSNAYRYLYFVYSLFTFIFMLGIYLSVQFINLLIIWGDIPSMVATSFLLMTNSVHAYKSRCPSIEDWDWRILGFQIPIWPQLMFSSNQERIQRLLNIVQSEEFSRDNEKYEKIFTWYAWQGIYHHMRYQSFGTMAVFCWGFTPIASAISGHARHLPMEAWYPYDTKVTPAFQITCAHQSFAVIFGCFHNIAIDTLITGLLNTACCQLEVLKNKFVELDTDEKKYSGSSDEHRLRKEFSEFIRHSVNIIRFVDEIRDIFGNVVLAQLLVNCVIICFTAFHITQMTVFVPVEIFGMMTYMCCMTYQIFIYCWNGNELTLQSQSLAGAAFSSNWWKFDKEFKEAVNIIIMRAHKPVVFTAGPILKLNLTTFVAILRMSYSFFTVLRTSAASN